MFEGDNNAMGQGSCCSAGPKTSTLVEGTNEPVDGNQAKPIDR